MSKTFVKKTFFNKNIKNSLWFEKKNLFEIFKPSENKCIPFDQILTVLNLNPSKLINSFRKHACFS